MFTENWVDNARMVINEQKEDYDAKSQEELYDDFAELIYDIYIDNQNDLGNENIADTEPQKLEYNL